MLLLKSGADIEIVNSGGETALTLAAKYNMLDLVTKLSSASKNIDYVAECSQRSALMWSVDNGNEKLGNILLGNGASLYTPNKSGNTAFAIDKARSVKTEKAGAGAGAGAGDSTGVTTTKPKL